MNGEHDPMVLAAAARARVTLVDGRTATLIWWSPPGGKHRRRGLAARVILPNGEYRTIRPDQIAEVHVAATAPPKEPT